MIIKLDQLISWLKECKIIEVECLIFDLIGIVCGKILLINKFIVEKGMCLLESVLLQIVIGDYVEDDIYYDLFDLVDIDMVCCLDENVVFFVFWVIEFIVMVIYDIFDKFGNFIELLLCNIFKCVLKMYVDKGWWLIVVLEMEFYLIKCSDDFDYLLQVLVGCFGCQEIGCQLFFIDVVNEFDLLFEDMYDWCEVQGFDLDMLIYEEGIVQMEINFCYGDVFDLVDQILVFKCIMCEVVFKYNVVVIFMVKLMIGELGSVMYLYQSIVDVKIGKNIFFNVDGIMSELFLYYIGGLQKFILEVLLLFVFNVNLFCCFLFDILVLVNVEWGEENCIVGLCVLDFSLENCWVENCFVGVDVNFYLVLVVSLLCGYIGMVEGIKLSVQVKGCGYECCNLCLLLMIEVVLECMENCKFFEQYFGSKFISGYVVVKCVEYENFKWVISFWEWEFFLFFV